MSPRRKPKSLTANQLVAANLRRARERFGLTQEEAAERLEPYLGVRWTKATFSAAERSVVAGRRAREFSANELLAFARVFGVSVSWFFLPPEYEEELPDISCGGPELVSPRGLIEAAVPQGGDREEGTRLRAIARRLPESEETIRHAAFAQIEALVASVTVPNVTKHAADLRRVANALESAEDKARDLFAAAYENEERKEKDDA
jgi:transcriptional regulator with XRE-family HTH domain